MNGFKNSAKSPKWISNIRKIDKIKAKSMETTNFSCELGSLAIFCEIKSAPVKFSNII
jgi:hypothetical protein